MTGTKAMAHSLKHAPTREEGQRLVMLIFRVNRMDGFTQSRRWVRVIK